MRPMLGATAALLCLAGAAEAAEMSACNVTVDVMDPDPKGTNVREAPSGRIVAVLPAPAGDNWIEAHVLGQQGDWFLIDGAKERGDGERAVFRGRGYVHRSVLGASGLQNGAPVFTDHDVDSPRLDPRASGDQRVDLLGCWGDFVKIHIKKGVGWTKGLCLNQRTTCV
jgi:hypothetical protein